MKSPEVAYGHNALKTGLPSHNTPELIRAQDRYESSRSKLKAYILVAQSTPKLRELRYDKQEIAAIRTHGEGHHMYWLALHEYGRYKNLLSGYDVTDQHTFADVWEEAAGGIFEEVWGRYPEYENEPWHVPRPVAPPELYLVGDRPNTGSLSL